jgi:hypothetical protein
MIGSPTKLASNFSSLVRKDTEKKVEEGNDSSEEEDVEDENDNDADKAANNEFSHV